MSERNYKKKKYQPPTTLPEPLVLSMEERWALTVPSIVGERAEVQIELASLRRELLLVKLDPEGKVRALEQQMKTAADELEQQQKAHAIALAQVQQRLGIEAFTFDPDTGVVTVEVVSTARKE